MVSSRSCKWPRKKIAQLKGKKSKERARNPEANVVEDKVDADANYVDGDVFLIDDVEMSLKIKRNPRK